MVAKETTRLLRVKCQQLDNHSTLIRLASEQRLVVLNHLCKYNSQGEKKNQRQLIVFEFKKQIPIPYKSLVPR